METASPMGCDKRGRSVHAPGDLPRDVALSRRSGRLLSTDSLRSRPRTTGRWCYRLSSLQAACRLQELVVVLACGEDAGVSGLGRRSGPQSQHCAVGRHPGGHAVVQFARRRCRRV